MRSRLSLKALERRWRAFCLRRVIALLQRRGRPGEPPPDWDARPHRVLFLRHDRIGDMIVSTGLLRAIATSRPTIRLEVLASPANAPIVAGDPHVAGLLVMDKRRPWEYPRLAARLRRAGYDAVIDCMVTAPSLTTILLMLATGARYRIGIAGRGVDDALTVAVPPRPGAIHILEHLSALATVFGVDPAATDWRPAVALTAAERAAAEACWRTAGGEPQRRRLLVNVSAGKPSRNWPVESFLATLHHLLRRHPDLCIVIVGAPAEHDRMHEIARASGTTAVPTGSIREAVALVAAADFVFTPDTSIGHAASAFSKPTVAMYLGGGSVGQWGVYGCPGAILESTSETHLDILVEDVIAPLDALLEQPYLRPDNARRNSGSGDVG